MVGCAAETNEIEMSMGEMVNNEMVNLSSVHGIPIICWNIRSLYSKYEEVVHLITYHKPKLAFFVESWLKSEIPNEMITIPDY